MEPELSAADMTILSVGVISDTHGHLYPEVKKALEGVSHIIHAGDIGGPQIIAELQQIAPVTAVRGNCDFESWAQALPLRAEVELAGVRILVTHIAARLKDTPDPGGFAVVVTGHSHLAAMDTRGGVLHLNPGSAGPRRFERPRTVAKLAIRPEPGSRLGGVVRDSPGVAGEILVVSGR